jgi:hypothetical protein
MAIAVNATAIGTNAMALDDSAIASGNGSSALAARSSAYGNGATAAGVQSTAIGNGTQALGTNSTALGTGATVNAGTTDSAAIGSGAVAKLTDQMVFGTANNTYTAPGMDSYLSRARQTGLLGVVTSDAFGNLASDNGALYKQVAQAKSGAAVAMALSDPSLRDSEKFGVKINYGGFDGANAVGLSTIGELGKNVLSNGDRLTLSGAVGWGSSNVNGYNQSVAGGRAGLQLTW